jgi:hypothetical protein
MCDLLIIAVEDCSLGVEKFGVETIEGHRAVEDHAR